MIPVGALSMLIMEDYNDMTKLSFLAFLGVLYYAFAFFYTVYVGLNEYVAYLFYYHKINCTEYAKAVILRHWWSEHNRGQYYVRTHYYGGNEDGICYSAKAIFIGI